MTLLNGKINGLKKPWIFIVGKVADFKKVFIEYVDYKKFVLGMRYHRIQTKMYYNGKTIQEIIRRLFRERK